MPSACRKSPSLVIFAIKLSGVKQILSNKVKQILDSYYSEDPLSAFPLCPKRTTDVELLIRSVNVCLLPH